MSDSWIPFVVVSGIWAIVGFICPLFAKGNNKQVIQVSFILTAFCCWLFWLCCYLSQLHPLIGPELKPEQAAAVLKQWAGKKE